MLTNLRKVLQFYSCFLKASLNQSKYKVASSQICHLMPSNASPIFDFCLSKSAASHIRCLHASAVLCKVKGKKVKSSKKIQELIRPADAAKLLDLEDVQMSMKDKVAQLKTDYARDFRIGADIPLEQIDVVIEGDTYALNEVAQINKPSPRLIQVDMISFPEFVKVAEKAIRASKWNLNPSVSGTIIKIPIPQATAEHRAAVAKHAKQRLRLCKDELLGVVSDIERDLKQHKTESEDLIHILNQQIKIYCDHFVGEAEALFKGKEKEILHPS